MNAFDTTVEPHEYVPYRWSDRLHPTHGRCLHCLVQRSRHPVSVWAPARAINDGRRYSHDRLMWLALQARRELLAATSTGQGDPNG